MSTLMLIGAVLCLLAFTVLAVVHPRISLVSLVALDVSNINGVVQDHLGTSPYKPQLALATIALMVMARRRMFRFSWSPVLLGVMVLLAGFCLGFTTAADPVTSQNLLVARARDLFYFLIVFALVLSTDKVMTVVKTAVVMLSALAALTVFHEFVLHNSGDLFGLSRVPLVEEDGALTPRHAGTSSDVNFWARLLILFLPMSLSLLAANRTWRARVLWGGCALSLTLGVYLTQSRGGFIALLVGLVVWLALAGGGYRKVLLYLPVALGVIIPLSGIGSRLATLTSITASSTATADPSVVTRKRLQLDAWHMFLSSPVTGHGIGSYGTLFPSYDRISNFYQPVDIVVAAHNFYLEQAADGGVLLLLAWAVFIGTVLFAALRAAAIARRQAAVAERFVALGVVGGICGWLVASIFLHLSDFRALLLLAAIAAALDVQMRRRVSQALPLASTGRGPGKAAVRGLAALAVLCAIAGGELLRTSLPARYSAAATLAVLPAATAVDPSVAYQLDVVSRGLIVPTFAELLNRSIIADELQRQAATSGEGSVRFRAAASRLGGSVVLTVTGSSRQAVTSLGAAAVALSEAEISSLKSSYRLTGAVGDPTSSHPNRGAGALLVLLSVVIALVARARRAPLARESGASVIVADIGPRALAAAGRPT